MKFEGLRIIEAGLTKNSWSDLVVEGDENSLSTGILRITPESLSSLVELGNKQPIHCRKTHNGFDLLDGYVGKFSNFREVEGVVYADLEFSEAMEEAYPQEVKFMSAMIEKEPDMLGISVVDEDIKVWNEKDLTWDVTKFTELYSCDLVGLPAATSSLFNNQNSKNKMGIFSGVLSKFSKKTELAEQIVESVNGEKITIRMKGEEAAVGDEVIKEDGTAVEDGELTLDLGDEGKIVVVVKDGKIEEFKEFKEEEEIEEEIRETRTPDEFAKELDEVKTKLSGVEGKLDKVLTQLSKQTKNPPAGGSTVPSGDSKSTKTELSKDKAQAALKKFLNVK